ncbi:helix-turn-helix domain-containing protein [Streptomyces sp. IB201691-2A2]|uniref:winged helix-turn-helix transcriptional regulator n=1 Tax=Streptomyces sp. IB201691-2A2 TaxID=2561920 RepID=UPI00117E19BB|nr:transcriptional regulator [Streptomyces sp. IB201691-2A2]
MPRSVPRWSRNWRLRRVRRPRRCPGCRSERSRRQFERHGIVTRTTYAEIPPRVVYALTPLGEGLSDVLEAMGTWALTVPDPGADVAV